MVLNYESTCYMSAWLCSSLDILSHLNYTALPLFGWCNILSCTRWFLPVPFISPVHLLETYWVVCSQHPTLHIRHCGWGWMFLQEQCSSLTSRFGETHSTSEDRASSRTKHKPRSKDFSAKPSGQQSLFSYHCLILTLTFPACIQLWPLLQDTLGPVYLD